MEIVDGMESEDEQNKFSKDEFGKRLPDFAPQNSLEEWRNMGQHWAVGTGVTDGRLDGREDTFREIPLIRFQSLVSASAD